MSNKDSHEKSKIVTTKEMAEILGLSDRRIRQLENEGSLVKVALGKFDLPQSIQKYIQVIKEQSESDEETNLRSERTLLIRAKRKFEENKLLILEGKLHLAEDVERVMADMLTNFRARCLAIPSKVAPMINGQGESVVKKLLTKEIHLALTELSNYNPDNFKSDDLEEFVGTSDDVEPKEKKAKSKKK